RLNVNPLNTWLVFELLGLIGGAVLSAVLHNRLEFSIGKSPKITKKTRLIAALSGGVLWGVGSQLGRGCTSGLIMSGMAVNSLSGYIGLMAVFGGGFMFAYFVRKLWI
ncbi:MAG: YeeE/YedE thiosulfate transporter family protein, partial [Bacteroidota bacterium]|nr:YeeE/YedE thiosulfate transporter family protein [Bacteroidota bacterium]